jgi:HD-like signal output (HDOD) protein
MSATPQQLKLAAEFLDGLPDLPSLSPASVSIVRSIDLGRDNFPALARVVEGDPVLAGRVLKVANSAYYAAANRLTSISSAIARLGIDEVRALVSAAALIRQFQNDELPFDLSAFWNHSLTTALACHAISSPEAQPSGRLMGDNPYYLAGLMHHLGLLVEAIHSPKAYRQAAALSKERQCSMEAAELEVMGFAHPATAAVLFERWQMPTATIDAALYHLDPANCPGDQHSAQVVHMAGLMAHGLGGYPFEGVTASPGFDAAVLEQLGWSMDRLDQLKSRVESQAAQAAWLYRTLV